MKKKTVTLEELKQGVERMEEAELTQATLEIDEWSDTGLVQINLLDKDGEWL